MTHTPVPLWHKIMIFLNTAFMAILALGVFI